MSAVLIVGFHVGNNSALQFLDAVKKCIFKHCSTLDSEPNLNHVQPTCRSSRSDAFSAIHRIAYECNSCPRSRNRLCSLHRCSVTPQAVHPWTVGNHFVSCILCISRGFTRLQSQVHRTGSTSRYACMCSCKPTSLRRLSFLHNRRFDCEPAWMAFRQCCWWWHPLGEPDTNPR